MSFLAFEIFDFQILTPFLQATGLTPVTLHSPSKPVDKESDREGAEDASDREDGHRDGPDSREGGLGDLFLVALEPCLIDELFNNLTHTHTEWRIIEKRDSPKNKNKQLVLAASSYCQKQFDSLFLTFIVAWNHSTIKHIPPLT